jgi:antitoxin component of RelBE/YafQ-DinJ toxin-antitoxin module
MTKTNILKIRIDDDLQARFDAAVLRCFGLTPDSDRATKLRKRSGVLRRLIEQFIRDEAARHRARTRGAKAS